MRLALLLGLVLAIGASDERLAGGSQATITDFPYQCAVFERVGSVFVCGCSLVAPSWVLTAASCLRRIVGTSETDVVVADLQILLGGARLDSPQRVFNVVAAQMHPSWSAFSTPQSRVDLAWMQMEYSVPRTPETVPTLLASADDTAFWMPGTAAAVTGWGASAANGTGSIELQRVDAPIRTTAVCNSVLRSQGQQVLDGSSYLCAGPGGNGPCAGDAGSALVAFSAGEFRQVGVVSRSTGSSCGAGDSFGVYTLVGPYRDLIQNSINEPLYAGMAVRVHASLGLLLGLLFLGWLL